MQPFLKSYFFFVKDVLKKHTNSICQDCFTNSLTDFTKLIILETSYVLWQAYPKQNLKIYIWYDLDHHVSTLCNIKNSALHYKTYALDRNSVQIRPFWPIQKTKKLKSKYKSCLIRLSSLSLVPINLIFSIFTVKVRTKTFGS